MDGDAVRTSLAPHERELPHYEDLYSIYRGIGSVVLESNTEYDYVEDKLAESIFSEQLKMAPGTDVYEKLRAALEADATTYEDAALEAGLALSDEIFANARNDRGVITGYLNAAFEIDKLKIGLRGQSAPVVNEYAILSVVRTAIAEGLPCDMKTIRTVSNIGSVLDDLIEKQPFFGWFRPKLLVLSNAVALVNNVRVMGEKVSAADEQSIEQYGGQDEIQRDISGFMRMTLADRKYGVKSAYTAASIGGSWIYYDGPDYNALHAEHLEHNTDALSNNYVAVIFHTSKSEIDDLRMQVEEENYSPTARVAITGGALIKMGTDLQLYLYKDGNLYLDTQGLTPFRQLLKNSPGAYEALQAELIANFHDLVMPPEVVNSRNAPKYIPGDSSGKYDPILDLLLPRLRRISQEEKLPEEDKPTRTVRKHDVEWFVRELPRGWTASPEAIENARIHNVELKPNQTFVRSHKRGKDNEVKGHVIKRTNEL